MSTATPSESFEVFWPRALSVTVDDLRGFFRWALRDDAAALEIALTAIDSPPVIPKVPPGFKDGGGANNLDRVLHNEIRRRLTGEEPARVAVDWWLQVIQKVARDSAHRYLEGPFLCGKTDLVVAQGRLSLKDLEGYLPKKAGERGFPNVRVVTRSMANVAALYAENPSDTVLATLRRAIEWFFRLEWSEPAADHFGEVPGWGSLNTSFQSDWIGKPTEWDWRKIRNSAYKPFVAFSIQYNAITTVRRLVPDSYSRNLLSRAQGRLRRWFWDAGYTDHENPLLRGIGPTRPTPIFEETIDGGLAVAKRETGGNMLYPMWGMLEGRPTRDVRRMVQAFILQSALYWRDLLPEMVFSTELLELVYDWREAMKKKTEPEDPGEPEEPMPGRLGAAFGYLRDGGYLDEAGLFRSVLRDGVSAASSLLAYHRTIDRVRGLEDGEVSRDE